MSLIDKLQFTQKEIVNIKRYLQKASDYYYKESRNNFRISKDLEKSFSIKQYNLYREGLKQRGQDCKEIEGFIERIDKWIKDKIEESFERNKKKKVMYSTFPEDTKENIGG